MNEAITLGDNIIMTKSFLSHLMSKNAKEAAEEARKETIKTFSELQDQKTFIDTNNAALQLDCTQKTVIRYITTGHKKAKKLSAKFNGKSWKITQFDLNEFKERL